MHPVTGGKFYVDGQVKGVFDPTVCRGDLSNTLPLRIGARLFVMGFMYYRGVIDEPAFYRRAPLPEEVAAYPSLDKSR